jgi:hypothetical protein
MNGENCIIRSTSRCNPHQILAYSGDTVKDDGMGGVCGMSGEEEKGIQNFDRKT